jgi:hypothetical protein
MHHCQSMISGCSSRHRCFERVRQEPSVPGQVSRRLRMHGAILNAEFVMAHKLPWVRRKTPVQVRNTDGQHQEDVSWEIGKLERGISGYLPVEWLTKHNPEIDWQSGVLRWRSQYCKDHCLPVSMRDAV